jgi:DNA-binding response OmpR family regulator
MSALSQRFGPASARILLIDDEAGLRLTFACILGDEGYAVTTAANGLEALRALALDDYDLAYLDIHLPEMDGLAVLKEIHQRYPELPVILITAHASVQSAVEAMRLGASDYLLKPVDPTTLIARTHTVLDEHQITKRQHAIQNQMRALQAEWLALNIGPAPVQTSSTALPDSVDTRSVENRSVENRYVRRGSLTLDLHTYRTTFAGRTFSLPPATFEYLATLARHAPHPLGYQALVTEAQGYKSDLREAQELTRWHIHKLREALEPDPKQPRHLLTVRGVGYRLVVD